LVPGPDEEMGGDAPGWQQSDYAELLENVRAGRAKDKEEERLRALAEGK
jgi:hypothetical protein